MIADLAGIREAARCPPSLSSEGRTGCRLNSSGWSRRFGRFCNCTTSFLCITAGSLLAMFSPLLLKWLIDGIIPQRGMGLLLVAVALIFLGHQGRVALTSLGSYIMLSASQKWASPLE